MDVAEENWLGGVDLEGLGIFCWVIWFTKWGLLLFCIGVFIWVHFVDVWWIKKIPVECRNEKEKMELVENEWKMREGGRYKKRKMFKALWPQGKIMKVHIYYMASIKM